MTIVRTNKMYVQIRKENVMTKDKRFMMRCDQQFLDTLARLSDEMGVSKSQFIEITVGIYPSLVDMYNKLDKMIADAKCNL
jgi:hypothetical protein